MAIGLSRNEQLSKGKIGNSTEIGNITGMRNIVANGNITGIENIIRNKNIIGIKKTYRIDEASPQSSLIAQQMGWPQGNNSCVTPSKQQHSKAQPAH